MAKQRDIDRLHGTRIGVPGSPLPLAWWQPPHVVVREIHDTGDELPVGPARAGAPARRPSDPQPRRPR